MTWLVSYSKISFPLSSFNVGLHTNPGAGAQAKLIRLTKIPMQVLNSRQCSFLASMHRHSSQHSCRYQRVGRPHCGRHAWCHALGCHLRCPDTLFGLHHSRYCLGRSRVWVGGWVGGKGIFSGCLQVVFKKNDRYCCTCATKGLWMNLQ